MGSLFATLIKHVIDFIRLLCIIYNIDTKFVIGQLPHVTVGPAGRIENDKNFEMDKLLAA
jgi:hypothetical protein